MTTTIRATNTTMTMTMTMTAIVADAIATTEEKTMRSIAIRCSAMLALFGPALACAE